MIEVTDIQYYHELSGGGDPWRILGKVYGHPRFADGGTYFPSVPAAFDEETLIVTSLSGKQYKILSFNQKKEDFIAQLKKDIECGYYEVH